VKPPQVEHPASEVGLAIVSIPSPGRVGRSFEGKTFVQYHDFLPRANLSTLKSIFRQLCPRCRTGKIFRSTIYWGWPKMNDRCPVCGLYFYREQGYFLGAMYISYILGSAVICVFAAVLWGLTNRGLEKITIWAILLFLPFAPVITLLSRVLWIYVDQAIDPAVRKPPV
jgi:uncharacterized protein (DUF983 family)